MCPSCSSLARVHERTPANRRLLLLLWVEIPGSARYGVNPNIINVGIYTLASISVPVIASGITCSTLVGKRALHKRNGSLSTWTLNSLKRLGAPLVLPPSVPRATTLLSMMSTMAQMPGLAVKSSDGLFVDGEKSAEIGGASTYLLTRGVRIVALLHCGKNRSLRRINSEN